MANFKRCQGAATFNGRGGDDILNAASGGTFVAGTVPRAVGVALQPYNGIRDDAHYNSRR